MTWFDSSYGRIVVLKTALSAVLLGLGAAHRRRSLPALAAGQKRAFARLAGGEALVFAGVLGLAVALARTGPPPRGELYGVTESLLGFPMPAPITAARLALDWYPEPLFTAAAAAGIGFYLAGWLRLRRRGIGWSIGRGASWCAGWLVVLVAMSSGLARYAPVLTWAHMLQHLLLSMVAAPLLALGAPITLALRSLKPAAESDGRGPRELLLRLTTSRLAGVLSHPGLIGPLFALSPFIVYFTGLYELSMRYHFGHLAISAHFLIVAYLFFNLVIGPDPLPHRPSFPLRLVMLLLAAIAHAIFGIVLMQSTGTLAGDWFALIDRPWPPAPAEDVRIAGGVAWVFGEIPFAVTLLVLVNQWHHSDEREQRRYDRAVELPGTKEAKAVEDYNLYLAQLAALAEPTPTTVLED